MTTMITKKTAIERYHELTRENVEMLEAMITEMKDEHDKIAMKEAKCDWSHAGTAAHYNDKIKEIYDSIFGLGEFAE